MGDTTTPLMTTVFTESDYCTELFASFAEHTHTSLPTLTRSWSSDDNNHGACHPYDAGRGPFSPGWYCPAGYETASTSTYDESSYLDVYCCPSGYSIDIDCSKTTSDVRVWTTDATLSPYFLTFPTAVAQARPFWLQQPLGADIPPTPAPTGPTDDGDDDSDESGGQSDSGSTDGNGSGGLSTGAKAGIGVGVALAVIIIAVVALFLWLRKRKTSKKASSVVEISYVGDLEGTSDDRPPELEDTVKSGEVNGAMDPNIHEKGATEVAAAYPTSHNELHGTERNTKVLTPRGEELDGAQREKQEPQCTELDSAQRTELQGTQRMELDSVQRMELESQERRRIHELETGMSATVRDVPELMHSAEYYELEGPMAEPRSELESTAAAPAPATLGEKHQLSELEQIEAEEERLRKRREELLAAKQQQGK